MTTAVLAWLTVAGACTGAVLFGQTARSAPARGRRPASRTAGVGVVVSRSGPWVAALLSAVGGAVTGQWLVAAAAALVGVVVAAVLGAVLAPR